MKEDYEKFDKDVKGLKIGLPEEYYKGLDKQIEKEIWDKIKKLESLGAKYEKVSLKTTDSALQSYYIIATGEASTNLAKLCGMRYGMEKPIAGNFNEYYSKVRSAGFGKEAKRRILLGTYGRMSGYRDQYYLKAMKVRTLVIWDFKKAFKNFDVLIAPTMPMPAPKFTEIEKLTPLQNYQSDILTVGPNLAGVPMLNIPTGTGGMHVMADHLKENNLLKVGRALE